MGSKYHDDNSFASDPGQIRFSVERYRRMEPDGGGFGPGESAWEERLAEHLLVGDSRAACVVSVRPLLVAAYTDEIDCIAMLLFPTWLVAEHALKLESRLLTVNTYHTATQLATYEGGSQFAADLIPGPNNSENYANFFPMIAEFLSDDRERIELRKSGIPEEEWLRCLSLGREYLRRFPERWRIGSPNSSWIPTTYW